MLPSRLLPLVLLFACAELEEAPVQAPEQAPAPIVTDGPGSLLLTVELPPRDGSPSTQVWLRDAAGDVDFGFLGNGTTKEYLDLAPGLYDVAARVPFEHDGPWIYVKGQADVRPGEAAEVRLALPEARTAGFAIVPERHSPPLYLLLANEGTVFPSQPRELGPWLSQQAYPDVHRFALQSDGRSHLDAIPTLEPGRYVLLWIANDWQTGDPPIQPRSIEIELVAGRTTTLYLEDKLTRWRVE